MLTPSLNWMSFVTLSLALETLLQIKMYPEAHSVKTDKCPLLWLGGSSERVRELAGAGEAVDVVTDGQRRGENRMR